MPTEAPCARDELVARRWAAGDRPCDCRVPEECATLADALGRLEALEHATVCLGTGAFSVPSAITSSVEIRGAGADETRLTADCNAFRTAVVPIVAPAVSVTLSQVSLVRQPGPGACNEGVSDARAQGDLTLRGVRVEGFPAGLKLQPPSSESGVDLVIERGSSLSRNGTERPVGGTAIERAFGLGGVAGGGRTAIIRDTLVEDTGLGHALGFSTLQRLVLERVCLRDNFGGVSVTGPAGEHVEVEANHLAVHATTGAFDGAAGSISVPALAAFDADVRIEDTEFVSNTLGLVVTGGGVTLGPRNTFDASGLVGSIGVFASCADVDASAGGSTFRGTRRAGLMAVGAANPGIFCPRIPTVDLRGNSICPEEGTGICVAMTHGLIVMNGFCAGAEVGVANIGGRVVVAGGNTFEPGIVEAIHLEEFEDVGSLPDFGADILTAADARPDETVVAGLTEGVAESDLRSCDAACQEELAIRAPWARSVPAGSGIAGNLLPTATPSERNEASSIRAAASLAQAGAGAP